MALTSNWVFVDDVVIGEREEHDVVEESSADPRRHHVLHAVAPRRSVDRSSDAFEREAASTEPLREVLELHLAQWHIGYQKKQKYINTSISKSDLLF